MPPPEKKEKEKEKETLCSEIQSAVGLCRNILARCKSPNFVVFFRTKVFVPRAIQAQRPQAGLFLPSPPPSPLAAGAAAAAAAVAAARTPEMFELRQSPTRFDAATGSVVAGRDRVRLFDGALAALRELTTQERFSDTQIAVASSTTQRQWALDCLGLFEVRRRRCVVVALTTSRIWW